LATARLKYGLLDIFLGVCLCPAHAIIYVSLSVARFSYGRFWIYHTCILESLKCHF